MTRAIGKQNIAQAAGDNSALRDILTKITLVSNQQAAKSTNYAGTPKQPAGAVKFANPNFIVSLSTLGLATSPLQANQQGALGSNAAKGKTIFSQVRAATGLTFDAGSNVTVFGGDAGTAQAELVCAGLDTSQRWYFQARSSFDGQTWNAWKNLNGGKPVNGNANGVELIPGVALTAIFSLAGLQKVTFGTQTVYDQTAVAPVSTDIAHTLGIPSPNGYVDQGANAQGINCSINAQGVVTMNYDADAAPSYSGSATVLLLGWLTDATGTAPQAVAVSGGTWAIFDLPGGSQLAFGSGRVPSGTAFDLPAGFSLSNVMAIATPASATGALNDAHGVTVSMAINLPTVDYSDGSGNHWAGDANWFGIAWSDAQSANTQILASGRFLTLSTPSGDLCFGMGMLPGGSTVTLPTGFAWSTPPDANAVTIPTALGFAVPGDSYQATGNHMHGIQLCAVDQNGQLALVYQDGQGHQWGGSVAYVVFAWA